MTSPPHIAKIILFLLVSSGHSINGYTLKNSGSYPLRTYGHFDNQTIKKEKPYIKNGKKNKKKKKLTFTLINRIT